MIASSTYSLLDKISHKLQDITSTIGIRKVYTVEMVDKKEILPIKGQQNILITVSSCYDSQLASIFLLPKLLSSWGISCASIILLILLQHVHRILIIWYN